MLTDQALYRLLAWLSPAFPVGAFAYSHGIEYAVEIGEVSDPESLASWLDGIIQYGSGRIDADLFTMVWRAVDQADDAGLARAIGIGNTMRGTSELSLESLAQGSAFQKTVQAAWPDAAPVDPGPVAYPVAVAMAAARIEAPLRSSLVAYLHGLAANLVSAALRAVPLGQTDGQRVIAGLEAVILAAAEAALDRSPEDFGGAAFRVDWTSMQHESQYTRLFRS